MFKSKHLFCAEGGEEIGVCPCEAHWTGRGSLPPLGEAGYLTPAGERGNTGKLGTSPDPQIEGLM